MATIQMLYLVYIMKYEYNFAHMSEHWMMGNLYICHKFWLDESFLLFKF
jgi:hypothetical protein